jgi:hypothetical protein
MRVAVVKLRSVERLPDGFLDAAPAGLLDLLGGPTLLHLEGARAAPLFVSLLLHGDESTGLGAVQRLLRRHAGRRLPRALSIFVGNVAAARARVRRLPGQPDYNRVWPGGDAPECAETALMRDVVAAMRPRSPFASIDVHNNSGINPFYACVTRIDPEFLRLATLFSRTTVFFSEPRGVQTQAFAELCPAVTVECGRPGEGDAHAAEFLDAVLHLAEFPRHSLAHGDVDLFHTVATVKVPPDVSISFDGSPADLVFRPDLDRLNFCELAPGTLIATARRDAAALLDVPREGGGNRWRELFAVRDGTLVLEQRLMPSMLTSSISAVRQDCLCYLMERLSPPG